MPHDTPAQTEPAAQPRIEHGADLFQQTETYLKAAIAKVVKIPADRIDVHEDFGNYGIDSLTIMHLNDRLGEDFQALPRTLFFEYITVHDLTAYFVTHHAERLELLFRQTAVSERGALYGATPRTEFPLPPGEGQGEGGPKAPHSPGFLTATLSQGRGGTDLTLQGRGAERSRPVHSLASAVAFCPSHERRQK